MPLQLGATAVDLVDAHATAELQRAGREVVQAAAPAPGPADLARPSTQWRRPRVAYLQHASDPVVWWSPDLILHGLARRTRRC